MAWQQIVAGAISGGSGLIGSMIANRGNRKLAEYAYEKNVDMWNRENEYNSPVQQMARYQKAGLNPNLIYESGSASAGNASQLPKYDAPTLSYDTKIPNVLDMMSKYQDIEVKQAQKGVIQENARIMKTEADMRSLLLDAELHKKYTEGFISKIDYLKKSAELSSDWGYDVYSLDAERYGGKFDKNKYDQMSSARRENSLNELQKSQFEVSKMGINNEIARLTKNWFRFNQLKGLIPTFVK